MCTTSSSPSMTTSLCAGVGDAPPSTSSSSRPRRRCSSSSRFTSAPSIDVSLSSGGATRNQSQRSINASSRQRRRGVEGEEGTGATASSRGSRIFLDAASKFFPAVHDEIRREQRRRMRQRINAHNNNGGSSRVGGGDVAGGGGSVVAFAAAGRGSSSRRRVDLSSREEDEHDQVDVNRGVNATASGLEGEEKMEDDDAVADRAEGHSTRKARHGLVDKVKKGGDDEPTTLQLPESSDTPLADDGDAFFQNDDDDRCEAAKTLSSSIEDLDDVDTTLLLLDHHHRGVVSVFDHEANAILDSIRNDDDSSDNDNDDAAFVGSPDDDDDRRRASSQGILQNDDDVGEHDDDDDDSVTGEIQQLGHAVATLRRDLARASFDDVMMTESLRRFQQQECTNDDSSSLETLRGNNNGRDSKWPAPMRNFLGRVVVGDDKQRGIVLADTTWALAFVGAAVLVCFGLRYAVWVPRDEETDGWMMDLVVGAESGL